MKRVGTSIQAGKVGGKRKDVARSAKPSDETVDKRRSTLAVCYIRDNDEEISDDESNRGSNGDEDSDNERSEEGANNLQTRTSDHFLMIPRPGKGKGHLIDVSEVLGSRPLSSEGSPLDDGVSNRLLNRVLRGFDTESDQECKEPMGEGEDDGDHEINDDSGSSLNDQPMTHISGASPLFVHEDLILESCLPSCRQDIGDVMLNVVPSSLDPPTTGVVERVEPDPPFLSVRGDVISAEINIGGVEQSMGSKDVATESQDIRSRDHDLSTLFPLLPREEPFDVVVAPLDLGSSKIVSMDPGSTEVIREEGEIVRVKGPLGAEVSLDPQVLFAGIGEEERIRLMRVFHYRPNTFMCLGDHGSIFIRFYLESFGRMLGLLEGKIGDFSDFDFRDLAKSFGDLGHCLIKTDWLKAKLEEMGRLKTLHAERAQAGLEVEQLRAKAEELKVLLSEAEKRVEELDLAITAFPLDNSSLDLTIEQTMFRS